MHFHLCTYIPFPPEVEKSTFAVTFFLHKLFINSHNGIYSGAVFLNSACCNKAIPYIYMYFEQSTIYIKNNKSFFTCNNIIHSLIYYVNFVRCY